MSRRLRTIGIALSLTIGFALPGCQTGGGGAMFDSANLIPTFGLGGAPSGQTEPKIVLHEEPDPPRDDFADFE